MQQSPSVAGYKAKVIKPPASEQPLKSLGQRPKPTSSAKVEEPKEEEGNEEQCLCRFFFAVFNI